jgi:hypothetical protein
MMPTAEQKIRAFMAENAWRFQHEGSHVTRWLTGGTAADAYVTFDQQDDKIIARCPSCGREFGHFNANYDSAAYKQLGAIREFGSRHLC